MSTIPVSHDINPYVALLRRDGTLVLLGALGSLEPGLHGASAAPQHRRVAGSSVAGLAGMQEVIDCCAKHGITADVEVIPIQQINEASGRMRQRAVQ